MVELNQRDRTIKIKIVYYGPPVGGKTTNLRVLHEGAFGSRRGELISINSAQDRTILFDFLPLKTSGFRGFDVRLQLVAVPGQAVYASSRRVAMKATDAIVFVANSAIDRFEENTQSYKEMVQNLTLYQISPRAVPLVLQYNKRDLPSVLPLESLENALNTRKVVAIPAVASQGEGVLEAFSAILQATIEDLSRRFRAIEMAQGQTPKDWVADTIDGLFGRRTLAVGSPQPVAPGDAGPAVELDGVPTKAAGRVGRPAPDHRKVRIQLSEDFPRPPLSSAQHAKVQESLAESYAEASAELSLANAELREERDLARRQIEQVGTILVVADELAKGMPLPQALGRALAVFGEAGDTPFASILLAGVAGGYKGMLKPPMKEEPLIRTRKGLKLLEQYAHEDEPMLVRGSETLEAADVLGAFQPALAAMALIPLKTPTRQIGFAVLYYTRDAALPGVATLGQLGLLARIVRSPLELVTDHS